MDRKTACTVAGIVLGSIVTAWSAESDGNVWLTLEGGIAKGGESVSDLVLEVKVRGGQWPGECWATTPDFCRNHAWGVIGANELKNGARTLKIDVTVDDDPYFPGGKGMYEIRVREKDGILAGDYNGQFNAKDVSGKVAGRCGGVWPDVVKGHVPLQAGEHPRLIFRKSDLPVLKERAEKTPEGKAMMAQFLKLLDKGTPMERGRAFPGENIFEGMASKSESAKPAAADEEAEAPVQENDKFSSWPAVGYGFAWQMTGDRKHADKAKDVIESVFFGGNRMGGQDIHHGPRIQGLALVYDLCYDGWDETFRRKVADEIRLRMTELYRGSVEKGGRMGGLNPVWWSNHNGIRAASLALGALAVLGDAGADGNPIDTQRYVDYGMRTTRAWFEMGNGNSGWYIEGDFYKTMTFRRGLAHFLHACEAAQGNRVATTGMADFFLTGWLLEAEPGLVLPGHDDLLWETLCTIGLMTVPADQMPGVKWILDRTLGMEGNRSFGINYAMIAPYALTRYPFGVEAKPPAESLPWFIPDTRAGHWVFRPDYKFRDKQDVLLSLNLNSSPRRSCHNERMGPMMDLTLYGFGVKWTAGSFMPRVHGMLSMTANAGATVRSWKQVADKVVAMDIDMDRVYGIEAGKDVARSVANEGGIGSFDVPGWGTMVDRGIRAKRSMVVDASGVSGSPLLIAVADRVGYVPEVKKTGRFGVLIPVTAGIPREMEGSRFVLGEKTGPTLAGVMVGGTASTTSVSMVTKGESLVVMVLQGGAAPEIKVEGEGLQAQVTVGKRVVRVVNGTLSLE